MATLSVGLLLYNDGNPAIASRSFIILLVCLFVANFFNGRQIMQPTSQPSDIERCLCVFVCLWRGRGHGGVQIHSIIVVLCQIPNGISWSLSSIGLCADNWEGEVVIGLL